MGWLYDEVIDSYFLNLLHEHPDILYCTSSVMASLLKNYKNDIHVGRLWSEEFLTPARYILAPFNPTNSHWELIAINLKSFTGYLIVTHFQMQREPTSIQWKIYLVCLESFWKPNFR